jgi:tetrahydromethanopterin S-methyltransferase subunit F
LKTLNELFREFAGKTSLQRDEHVKKLVGTEVQIVGELGEIASDYLSCWHFVPEVSSLNAIQIKHNGEQRRQQLLEYSSGDDVRMITRFAAARFGEPDYYTFDLVSIVRLVTREAKDKAKHRVAVWSGVASGAFQGFLTGIVLCIVLAVVVLPLYDWQKYGLGSPKNNSPWPQSVIAIATVLGAVHAYLEERQGW